MHEVDDADQATSFLGLGLAGDRQLALDKVPLAKALNQKLRGFLATSGAKIFNMTQRFDGGYVQVSSYNGIERAFIYAEPTLPLEPDDLATVQILSGVVKDADLIVISPPLEEEVLTLRGFKPTAQTWGAVFKRDPDKPTTSFNDEPRLAVKISDEVHYLGEHLDPLTTVPFPDVAAQYKEICSSMYSGLMAKAVQVILGYGKLQSPSASEIHRIDGVQVKYNWRWAKCHGIVRGAGNALWLVEISVTNGVLAMPLPMFKNTVVGTPVYQSLVKSKQDVLRETALLFGGLPSGGTFPTGGELTAALASGDVLRLATAAHMAPFFDKSYYSSWMGWSFNLGGVGVTPQAHNTCYTAEGVATGFHYKIVFNIGKKKSRRLPNEPIAEGNATLSLVGSGSLKANIGDVANSRRHKNYYAGFRVHDGDGFLAYTDGVGVPPRNRVYQTYSPIDLSFFGDTLANEKVVLIACHDGDTLDTIYLEHKFLALVPGETTEPPFPPLFGDYPSGTISGRSGLIYNWYESPPTSETTTDNFIRTEASDYCSYVRSDKCRSYPDFHRKQYGTRTMTTSVVITRVYPPDPPYYPFPFYEGTFTGADTYAYTEILNGVDHVCAWSAFSRDAYLIHQPATRTTVFTGAAPGAYTRLTTYSDTPKIQCITPDKPLGVEDLAVEFTPSPNRLIYGYGDHATFTHGLSNESAVIALTPTDRFDYGDAFYSVIKHSTFGKRPHIICAMPFDRKTIDATDAAVPELGSQSLDTAKQGPLLDTEDITNPLAYSFIGYI